jgi:hypothetical protein
MRSLKRFSANLTTLALGKTAQMVYKSPRRRDVEVISAMDGLELSRVEHPRSPRLLTQDGIGG